MSDYEYGKCSSCEYEKKPKDELPCKVCTYSCCKWTRKSTDKLERAIGYLNDIGWMQEHDKELTQRTWIPYEERLPREKEVVLITNSEGNVRCGQFRGTSGKRWFWIGNTLEMVEAWMPLPEPYEGERKDDE